MLRVFWEFCVRQSCSDEAQLSSSAIAACPSPQLQAEHRGFERLREDDPVFCRQRSAEQAGGRTSLSIHFHRFITPPVSMCNQCNRI